ncbi:MAG: type I-C CRISPR-associated protein Cas8c/Csd1 [Eubacteriales bacterium]
MILQALVSYYQDLRLQEKIDAEGWTPQKISYALELGEDGNLLQIIPYLIVSKDGKKQVPSSIPLPAAVKRTVGIAANFLWDNAMYMLEYSPENPEKAKKRFEACQELHLRLLDGIETPEANAVRKFFETWEPALISSELFSPDVLKTFETGVNLTFFFKDRLVCKYPSMIQAWSRAYNAEGDAKKQRCLVTGEMTIPQLTHPSIKRVDGAQSSGAALVSFNNAAFESFGKTQNLNAPMGKYAAFAYTSALNALLADTKHKKKIGDTTVVYWAEGGEEAYQDAMDQFFSGADEKMDEKMLDSLMEAMAKGKTVQFENIPLNPSNRFYILGLAPNFARISVRFFRQNTFGEIVANFQKHYKDIYICSDGRSKFRDIPLWALLRETVPQNATDKTPPPQLAGEVLRAVLEGSRYPETLLNQVMIRIRAEHDISRAKAAVIKGYLIRNTKNTLLKEAATVSLNESAKSTPYILGRLFSVLENTQETANPGLNATIKDRYFNSACAMPSTVFPLLLKLSNSHLKKIEGGKKIFLSKQIGELTDALTDTFPNTMSLQEQGAFILGYYHQTQKRFEKKKTEKTEESENV